MHKRRLLLLVPLLAVIIAGLLYLNPIPLTGAEASTLTASGTVEAIEVLVSPESSGRITEVLVKEGDSVEAGAPLLRLDDESLRIRRRQILATGQAALAAARLEQVSAQQALDGLYEDAPLMAAQAQLNLARAGELLDDAEYNWRVQQQGNRAGGETIASAEANLVLAEEEVERAEKAYNRLSGRADDDPARALARSSLAAAREHRDAIIRRLNWYKGHPDNIEQASLDAELAMAQAQVADARQEWQKLKDGPDPDAVALAEARLANAEAQLAAAAAQLEAELDVVDLELEKFVVRAPVSGVVITRNVEAGELIVAGAPALTIGRLDELTLTVYIPEDRYGQLRLGDVAAVSVDSFPGETFSASVQRIADRAEFTPRNVQTEEGRRTTVFAVQLSVDDPAGRLKPGMPADVRFDLG